MLFFDKRGKDRLLLWLSLLITLSCFSDAFASSERVIGSEYRRCASVNDRTQRQLRIYEELMVSLHRSVSHLPSGHKESFLQELGTLENRYQAILNRMERTSALEEGIRSDLSSKRPICSACLESRVRMYCSNGESIQDDTENLIEKALDLQGTLRAQNQSLAPDYKSDLSAINRCESVLDSVYRLPESVASDSAAYKACIELLGRLTDPVISEAKNAAAGGNYTGAIETIRTNLLEPAYSMRQNQWRISQGIEYYQLEDVDTATMTTDELRSYMRLTENPTSVWFRLRYSYYPEHLIFESVEPDLYISGQKVRLQNTTRAFFLNKRLPLESVLKGEKWSETQKYGEALWGSHINHPSDMGGLFLQLAPGNPPEKAGSIYWSSPLSFDWEHYRENRAGYESFMKYRVFPSIEIDSLFSVLGSKFSAEMRYDRYYGDDDVDSLDLIRFFGQSELSFRSFNTTGYLSAGLSHDRHPNSSGSEKSNRIETTLRGAYQINNHLSAALRARGVYESETFGTDTATTRYAVSGTRFILNPQLVIALWEVIEVTPDLLLERRRGDLTGSTWRPFLWETKNCLEPGIRVGLSADNIRLSLTTRFRKERVLSPFEEIFSDSHSFKAGADISFTPIEPLSIYLFTDYHYKVYSSSRQSANLSISGNITLRL